MDLRQLISPTMHHRLCYSGSVVGSCVGSDVGSRFRSEVGSRAVECQIECLVSLDLSVMWSKHINDQHRKNKYFLSLL